MNKADKYYISNLNSILDEMNTDENPRPKYKDGVSAHSYFITQIFEKYDICKNEFPITTLRNTSIKTGIKEMLTIYQDQCNTKEGFHKNGVFWWDNWMNSDNNIGRAYSHNIESHRDNEMRRKVVKIKPIIIDKKYSNIIEIPQKYELEKSIDENAYKRTNFNVGYLGEYQKVLNIDQNSTKILMDKWENMMRRCYSPKHQFKNNYKEIFVHQEWHSFENFLRDVRMLPQYHLAKEDNFDGWELDKDYYGSNSYSKYSCVFLSKKDNTLYNNSFPIQVNNKNLNINETIINLSNFCANNDLKKSEACLVINNKKNNYKGYEFERITDDENLYRYELSRNQINSLINSLKNNPFSRRNMTSFWNWSNIDKKELVECAYETLWTVRKKEDVYFLDMTLTQRSQDAIMATYINKTQYVALQMMVAKHLGYTVGTFAHMVQNYHIYDRHIDAAKEILSRKPLDISPIMKLNVPDGTNFYDIRLEDFSIENIEGIKKIKSDLEIAI